MVWSCLRSGAGPLTGCGGTRAQGSEADAFRDPLQGAWGHDGTHRTCEGRGEGGVSLPFPREFRDPRKVMA